MKLLKKTSLAAAIMAAPFMAQAGMVALDDASMSNVTGQSGVGITIGLESGIGTDSAVRIGGIDYTDEGQININNVTVGTANAGGIQIGQEINVLDNGQLSIVGDAVAGLQIGIGEVHLSAVDASTTSGFARSGDALVNDVVLNVDLGASTTLIGANSTFAADGVGTANGATGNTIVISSSSSLKLDSSSLEALGGNVVIGGLTFDDNGNAATIKQKIYATGNGVHIVMESIEGTLNIGSIGIGGLNAAGEQRNIGSLAVRDITMSGMTTTIRGL